MPKLLVSVRNCEEALTALTGPVDIIDIKEPSRGPLGAADPLEAQRIAVLAGDRVELSIALGELLEMPQQLRRPASNSWLRQFDYVKAGPAGITKATQAATLWSAWVACLPRTVQPVVVAYADWVQARTISPEDLVDSVVGTRVGGLLLDTCDKRAGLFEHLPIQRIENLIQRARRAGLWVAVAGSLSLQTIPMAVVMNPQIVAVRGAICDHGRRGLVNSERIVQVAAAVHGGQTMRSPAHRANRQMP